MLYRNTSETGSCDIAAAEARAAHLMQAGNIADIPETEASQKPVGNSYLQAHAAADRDRRKTLMTPTASCGLRLRWLALAMEFPGTSSSILRRHLEGE